MPRLPPPEGEERGMSDSKSARRYDDAAVELGVPIRKERADNPPAPPPCEDCKGIPNPAAMLNFDALDLVVAHHARLRAKDAEIAELRGFLSTLDECLRVLRGHLEAALARKEGKP